MAHLDNLKGKLGGGGARANLFSVELTGNGFEAGDMFLIKAASMPSSVIAPITVPFRGRQLQVPGDRTFEPWTITVLNDVNYTNRNKFEAWMDSISDHEGGLNNTTLEDIFADATVQQLDRAQKPVAAGTYNFKGIWPSNISAIDVSYDSENTIQEYTVEFQVQYWTKADVTA